MPFSVNVPMSEWQKVMKVAPNVAIKDIVLTGSNSSVNRDFLEGDVAPCKIDLNPFFIEHRLIDERVLVADVGLKVSLVASDEAQSEMAGNKVAEIEVRLSAGYDLPPPPIPPGIEDCFETFARYNALYNCWPFFREHVNYISSALRLPIMLPVLQLNPVAETKEPSIESPAPKVSDKKKRSLPKKAKRVAKPKTAVKKGKRSKKSKGSKKPKS